MSAGSLSQLSTGVPRSCPLRVHPCSSVVNPFLLALSRTAFLPLVFILLLATGCRAPIGADKAPPALVFHEIQENALNAGRPSADTVFVLHRFDQVDTFAKTPDAALRVLHQKAVQSGDRDLLYALSELNYLAAERLRRSVKPWEPRDARD